MVWQLKSKNKKNSLNSKRKRRELKIMKEKKNKKKNIRVFTKEAWKSGKVRKEK